MAQTPFRSPHRSDNEMLDILRRLEPVLAQQSAELARQSAILTQQAAVQAQQAADLDLVKREQAEMRKDVISLRESAARLDGRVSQLPTSWQMIGTLMATFAVAFTLLRYGVTQQ